jgi:hypothetical protein
MKVLELESATGRKFWADSLIIQGTYAGLLMGYPDAGVNDELITTNIGLRVTQHFGNVPLRMVDHLEGSKRYTVQIGHQLNSFRPFGSRPGSRLCHSTLRVTPAD